MKNRLILVPQYPAKLRYQEWWFEEFPKRLSKAFKEVIVLGHQCIHERPLGSGFSPINQAIEFECKQVKQYMELDLRIDDVLLLNDLSFPGIFANVLFHQRPVSCYAICHATSRNKYDYFMHDRKIKYPIEKSIAALFDKVFVATEYHKNKLGWDNIEVIGLPDPPPELMKTPDDRLCGFRPINTGYFSRNSIQKVNQKILRYLKKHHQYAIIHFNESTWEGYYHRLKKCKIVLITSKEETYGYQVVDAIKCGAIVLAPNSCSYPELLPKKYLYSSKEELLDMLDCYLNYNYHKHYTIENLMQAKVDNFYDVLIENLKK